MEIEKTEAIHRDTGKTITIKKIDVDNCFNCKHFNFDSEFNDRGDCTLLIDESLCQCGYLYFERVYENYICDYYERKNV